MAQKNKFKKNKKGFSLVEVLFTLVVLSVGVMAVSVLMVGNIKSAENAKNQIIAAQLAQEGVELVRNRKDNNQAPFDNWNSAPPAGLNYRVDSAGTFIAGGGDPARRLRLVANSYRHGIGAETKFFRYVLISISGNGAADPSTRIITATSYVTWNGSGFAAIGGFPGDCNIANKCVSVVSVMPDVK